MHVVKHVSPSLMIVGGVSILSTLCLNYMSSAGFWIYVAVQGMGFAVVLTASGLSISAFRSRAAWSVFFAACAGWMVCWSWFLTLGLLLPIPLVFWGALSSSGFLISAFIGGIGSDYLAAAIATALGLGSLMSTAIMAMNPIFASDYSYIPFGAGAVLGGIVLGLAPVLARRRSARQREV